MEGFSDTFLVCTVVPRNLPHVLELASSHLRDTFLVDEDDKLIVYVIIIGWIDE